MGYISEFSTDIRYVQGSENFVADTLSRVEINGIETLQEGINYAQIALDQRTDADLNQLLKNPTDTELRLSEYPVPHSNYMLWCDTSTSMIRPVIPSSWRKIIFNKLHGISHPGIKGTSKLISRRFVWTGMRKDISKWVRQCLSCQQCKIHRHTVSPLEKYKLPEGRFNHINMDIVGPLPESHGFSYMLTIIDRYTRYVSAIPMKDLSSISVVNAFLHGYVSHFGVPATVTTDRGAQFGSNLWTQLMQCIGAKRNRTTSYHPQCNGLIENFHRRLKDALRVQQNPTDWAITLPLVLLHIRNTVKEDLECSSAELVFGQTMKLPGQFHPNISEPVTPPHQFLEKLKGYFDFVKPQQTSNHFQITTFVDKNLSDCSHVWLRCEKKSHSLQPRYSGPYRILQRNDKNFTLDVKDSRKVVSIDRVKPVFLPESENFSVAEPVPDFHQNLKNRHG